MSCNKAAGRLTPAISGKLDSFYILVHFSFIFILESLCQSSAVNYADKP